MSHIFALSVLLAMRLIDPLGAPATSPPMSDYSNGALEMTVEHAKPQAGVTRQGQNLYGILTIRLKNISGETLSVTVGNPNCDFAIEIRDSTGNSPKLTALGERLLPKSDAERALCPVMSVRLKQLDPGTELIERWQINKLFHLEPSRPYTVRVRWVKGLPERTPSGRQLRRELSRNLTIQ